jgi:osmotically-inducible protein OsmY
MTAKQSNAVSEQELGALRDALDAAGIYVAAELRDGSLILSGEVDTTEMHDAAIDLAQLVAERHGIAIEDAIDVQEVDVELESRDHEKIGDGSFPGESSTLTDVGSVDPDQAAEEGIPYFPPTDPVIGEQLVELDVTEVSGGFEPTSMDDDVDRSTRQFHGDEEITEEVVRELRQDAATADLVIGVQTKDRVVTLIGEVASQEDADNAEAVAARVEGVDEVREELTVIGPLADRRG